MVTASVSTLKLAYITQIEIKETSQVMGSRKQTTPREFDKDALMHEYHILNMSQAEMASKYGYTQGGIRLVLMRLGIPIKSKARRDQKGSKNPAWAGDKITYFGAHKRIRKIRGTPQYCEKCGKTGPGRYEWASLSHNYLDPKDYIRLCKSCHNRFDGIVNNLKGKGK